MNRVLTKQTGRGLKGLGKPHVPCGAHADSIPPYLQCRSKAGAGAGRGRKIGAHMADEPLH